MAFAERKDLPMDLNEILSSMSDCGCTEEQASQFLSLKEKCCSESCIRYLKRHRKQLLDEIHQMHRKVECVDYLIRELEKQKESEA